MARQPNQQTKRKFLLMATPQICRTHYVRSLLGINFINSSPNTQPNAIEHALTHSIGGKGTRWKTTFSGV